MHRGYIALWRKTQDHVFFQEHRVFSKFEAWVDILMEAQHRKDPQEVIIGLTSYTCHYGECLKAVTTWARRWNWSRGKVERYFKLLQRLNQIRYKSEQKTSRITIINYGSYDPKRAQNEHQTDIKRTSNGHQTGTDNNVKNVKNENNITPPIVPPSKIPDIPKTKKPRFVPPTEGEVVAYFAENGYTPESARKAFRYYEEGDPPWHDSRGNAVKSWKQKMRGVWFKSKNSISNRDGPIKPTTYRQGQDAERRIMAEKALEARRADRDDKSGNLRIKYDVPVRGEKSEGNGVVG